MNHKNYVLPAHCEAITEIPRLEESLNKIPQGVRQPLQYHKLYIITPISNPSNCPGCPYYSPASRNSSNQCLNPYLAGLKLAVESKSLDSLVLEYKRRNPRRPMTNVELGLPPEEPNRMALNLEKDGAISPGLSFITEFTQKYLTPAKTSIKRLRSACIKYFDQFTFNARYKF